MIAAAIGGSSAFWFSAAGFGALIFVGFLTDAIRKERATAQAVAQAKGARLLSITDDWLESVKRDGLQPLAAANVNIILKPGEAAYYHAPSALRETRAVRYATWGGPSFRVCRGVSFRVGASRSSSEQEWTKVDDGILTVTNKRLIFNGSKADRVVPLSKIVSVTDDGISAVEVTAENRQKSMVFNANPVILRTIISILGGQQQAAA
jgi:hypothetical protein